MDESFLIMVMQATHTHTSESSLVGPSRRSLMINLKLEFVRLAFRCSVMKTANPTMPWVMHSNMMVCFK